MDTRALLFTDIVDSTTVVRRLGDAAAASLWSEHDRLARTLLAEHGGLEIDRSDGFLLLFDDVASAARFAVGYHAAVAGLHLAARVGIHHGPVTLRRNPPQAVARGAKAIEVEGLAKPLGARVMSLAAGGQTLLSGDAASALRSACLPGQELRSHGHYRLKGIEEPLPLFELGDTSCAFTPPPDAEKAYRVVADGQLWKPVRDLRHNLTPERDAFIGRRADLRRLAESLDTGSRLVSVLGVGGTGKTRLVRRYARAWLGDWPGGVYFCDLSEARGLEGICFAVAGALEVPLGKGDPAVQLGHAIAGRGRCLVILDNFEQVVQHAASTVGHWLDRAGDAAFVVTSRERLQIAGEDALPLEPLPPETDAIELFADRARAQGARFTLDPATREQVAQVARLLDGLPLAIELAAARARVLSPAQIVQRLKDRFVLLAGARGAAARQATLKAAIDWSWELLAPWERAALAQCSVFEGGFTMEAAEAVLDLTAWPEAPAAVDVIQSLVDKSLLRAWLPKASARLDIAEPYFGMYLSIHEYAAGRLVAQGAAALGEARRRHGIHYAQYGSDAWVDSLNLADGFGRRWAMAQEVDNFVVACRRGLDRGDADVAVPTLRATWEVLVLRGPMHKAAELGVEVERLAMSDARRCDLTLVQAIGARRMGRLADGEAGLRRALDQSRALGLRRREGIVLQHLGNVCRERGQPAQARALLEEALQVHREVGNRRDEGGTLGDLGNVHLALDEYEAATQKYRQALTIAEEIGNRGGVSATSSNLALVERQRGRLDAAVALNRTALEIAIESGSKRMEAAVLMNLAVLEDDRGAKETAIEHLERALRIARDIGIRAEEAVLNTNLGHLLLGAAPERAEVHFRASLTILEEVRMPASKGIALFGLAELLYERGDLAAARAALDEGEALLRGSGSELDLARLLCVKGAVLARAGEHGPAAAILQEVQRTAERLDAGSHVDLARGLDRLRQALR